MPVIVFVLALLVGATLGLFGGGGAILTVPVFVYALGVPAKSAIPMSFVVIGSASAVGAFERWRRKELDPRRGLMLGASAIVGAFAGARIGVRIPEGVQLSLFGLAVIVAASSMIFSATRPEGTRTPRPKALSALVFVLIGAFTGIVGVGGGFLFVPALVSLVGVGMIEATSISLMVIAMNAASALAGYAGHIDIDWGLAALFTAIVVATMIPAGALARRVPVHILKRSFAIVLIAIGVLVLLDNIR